MISTKTRETDPAPAGVTPVALGNGPTAVGVHVTTMKAIVQDRYGSPDIVEFRAIDKPVIGASDVLIRVRAAGVNPGDWAIVGGLPYIARPVYGMGKPKNRVRGTDVAGGGEGGGGRGAPVWAGGEGFRWGGA